MSDQVKEVKNKVDIVALIAERVRLKKAGRNFQGLCPFHSEKTPSFNVSPDLQIYKCFGCFPADELVKTPFGFHNIQDVVEGEYVVSGKGGLKKVLATHRRNYAGDLISLQLSKLTEPVRLTADHLVYVVGGSALYSQNYKYLSKRLRAYRKYPKEKRLAKIWKYFPIKKLESGKLEKGMTLLYPIDFEVSDVHKIDLIEYVTKKWPKHGSRPLSPPLEIRVNEDFLKLLGYYIAEGSNNRAYIRFSLGNHEEDFAAEIVALLKKVFLLTPSVHRRNKGSKTGIEVTCCNSIIANVFENLCGKGAENKRIPFVLQQLPFNKQKVLLEAIFKGDGHKRRMKKSSNDHYAITTVSRVLAEHIRDILLRLGYFPSVNVQDKKTDKKGVRHKKVYTAYWLGKPGEARYQHIYGDKQGNRFWLLPVRKVKKTFFKGKVYNLTVQDDHSYVANTFAVANCGESGDVFEFLEKFEGMEFPEALKFVADRVGVKLKDFRPGKEAGVRERLLAILNLGAEFYHYLLVEHKIGEGARAYLKKRGIWKKTIETFRLGYAPDSWESLQKYLVGKKKYSSLELERVGLVIKSQGQRYYDRFRGRIVFPLTNQQGKALGFSGRVLEEARESVDAKSVARQAKYINSPETEIYRKRELLYGLSVTKREIAKADQVVVVEGELDVLSSWQAGVKKVVAIKGSALSREQIVLLMRYTHNVVLALDADSAGVEATKRGIAMLDEMGMNVRVAPLVGGKDPDAIVQKDKDKWKKLVSKAVSVYDFYLASAVERFDVKSGEGKRLVTRELAPIWEKITNQVEQAHYIGKLAKALGVSEAVVSAEVERVGRGAGVESEKKEETYKRENNKMEVLEEYILQLVMSGKKAELEKLKELPGEWFESVAVRKVLEVIGERGEDLYDDEGLEMKKLIEALPAELVDLVQRIWLTNESLPTGDELKKEFEKAIADLERRYLRREMGVLSEKIAVIEGKKDENKEVARLREEFVAKSQQLAQLR